MPKDKSKGYQSEVALVHLVNIAPGTTIRIAEVSHKIGLTYESTLYAAEKAACMRKLPVSYKRVEWTKVDPDAHDSCDSCWFNQEPRIQCSHPSQKEK